MDIKSLPDFEGELFIDTDEKRCWVSLLSGRFGESFLEVFQRFVDERYKVPSDYSIKKWPQLEVLKSSNSCVVGSNAYTVTIANQILRDYGLRTIHPREVIDLLSSQILDLTDSYIDTSLVLKRKARLGVYWKEGKRLKKDFVKQAKKDGNWWAKLRKAKAWKIPYSKLELSFFDNLGNTNFSILGSGNCEVIEDASDLEDALVREIFEQTPPVTQLPRFSGPIDYVQKRGFHYNFYINHGERFYNFNYPWLNQLANSNERGRIVVVREETKNNRL